MINEQEGLYTLYLRGSENGQKVDAKRVISSVKNCLNPYEAADFDAMMNVKSHTLYIAKVKDAADMDAVKTAFQTRKEQMEQSFERYLEDQYEIAKAGQIVTSGNWVMLVICEDSPKVVDRFNELMGA